MDQRIDETQDPGRQQQEDINQGAPSAIGAEQADDRAQQCEAAENEAAGKQPGSEVGPLYLVARPVGEVTQRGPQKQWDGPGKQDCMNRVKRPCIGSVDSGSHGGFPHCGLGEALAWYTVSPGGPELTA